MKIKSKGAPVFNTNTLINCRGKILDLSTPRVMGILNVTPDSFYDGGKFTEEKAIINHVSKMVREGVDIVDFGAQSSRPGARFIGEKAELQRILPVVSLVVKKYPDLVISIDTFRSSVARKCIGEGASIINDISAGDLDSKMFDTVATLKVPYVLMHMQGKPATMQKDPKYKNVVKEVLSALAKKVVALRKGGVTDIIIDPGFGFGKNVEQNYELLASLSAFKMLGCPVLAGISRKSMICKVLKVNPVQALNGTTALNMVALMNGANILRVHDVKEAAETVKLYSQFKKSDQLIS